MSERIYATQAAWQSLNPADADAFFAAHAAALGLDTARWGADYVSAEVAATIAADVSAGMTLGLSGTPTFFIDGAPYTGPLSRDGIRAAIARAAAS